MTNEKSIYSTKTRNRQNERYIRTHRINLIVTRKNNYSNYHNQKNAFIHTVHETHPVHVDVNFSIIYDNTRLYVNISGARRWRHYTVIISFSFYCNFLDIKPIYSTTALTLDGLFIYAEINHDSINLYSGRCARI